MEYCQGENLEDIEGYLGNTENPTTVECYCIDDSDLTFKDFRLLSTDNKLFLKVGWVKAFITSADVLHSWSVPSFGIKMDACPGRLNEINFKLDATGQFFGQCSELCGVGHSFMPINVITYYLPEVLQLRRLIQDSR